MTAVQLRKIHARATELVKQDSPEERTLLAMYILELIECLPPELQSKLKRK